jgi:hypothetical protein
VTSEARPLASSLACSERAEATARTATPTTSPSAGQALRRPRAGGIRQASTWIQRRTSTTPAAASRVATPPKIRASQRARSEVWEAAATESTTSSLSRSSAPTRDDARVPAKPNPATSTYARGIIRANSRKAREAARMPTATGRSRRTTPTTTSTTRLRERARSTPASALASRASSCRRRSPNHGPQLGRSGITVVTRGG